MAPVDGVEEKLAMLRKRFDDGKESQWDTAVSLSRSLIAAEIRRWTEGRGKGYAVAAALMHLMILLPVTGEDLERAANEVKN